MDVSIKHVKDRMKKAAIAGSTKRSKNEDLFDTSNKENDSN